MVSFFWLIDLRGKSARLNLRLFLLAEIIAKIQAEQFKQPK